MSDEKKTSSELSREEVIQAVKDLDEILAGEDGELYVPEFARELLKATKKLLAEEDAAAAEAASRKASDSDASDEGTSTGDWGCPSIGTESGVHGQRARPIFAHTYTHTYTKGRFEKKKAQRP